jgi:ATP-dependent RNA helicase DDX5/DBP2
VAWDVLQLPAKHQSLLWSATWPEEVRSFASAITIDPKRVTINGAGLKANANISQKFITVSELEKCESLIQLLTSEFDGNRWVCFCSSKKRCDELTRRLRTEGWPAMGVHGEKCQLEREWVLSEFRAGNSPIMLATDLAARGLGVASSHCIVRQHDAPLSDGLCAVGFCAFMFVGMCNPGLWPATHASHRMAELQIAVSCPKA